MKNIVQAVMPQELRYYKTTIYRLQMVTPQIPSLIEILEAQKVIKPHPMLDRIHAEFYDDGALISVYLRFVNKAQTKFVLAYHPLERERTLVAYGTAVPQPYTTAFNITWTQVSKNAQYPITKASGKAMLVATKSAAEIVLATMGLLISQRPVKGAGLANAKEGNEL